MCSAELLADHARADLLDLAGHQGPQREGAVGQADQAVHLQAQGLQHAAHLAVLALGQGDGDPQVARRRGPSLALSSVASIGAVADALDGDPVLQRVELRLGRSRPRARAR